MGDAHGAAEAERTGYLSLERLVFFSDAVMAIAITLLAIDVRVPEIPAALAAQQLGSRLSALSPQIASFVISFTVIGTYWSAHHRYFTLIRSYDRALVLLNMPFLFFIVSLPFVSSLLGHYPYLSLGVIPYAGVVGCLGLAQAGIWWYASAGHRLVDPALDPSLIALYRVRPLATSSVFFVSIPITLWSPLAGAWSWLLAPLLVVTLLPRLMRRLAATPDP